MQKKLLDSLKVAAGSFIALAFASCAYDPYYSSSATVGGSYSTGYDSGYGGRSSTSLFISTGDPRWGYDPESRSYYDYNRRSYYDPYLYGYYPIGYRPVAVYGAPHPHGWSYGRSYLPPPSRYRDVRLSNYRDRESLYRNSSYDWARQVPRGSDRDERRGRGSQLTSRRELDVPESRDSRGFDRQDYGDRSTREGGFDSREQDYNQSSRRSAESSNNERDFRRPREFREQRSQQLEQRNQRGEQRSQQLEQRAQRGEQRTQQLEQRAQRGEQRTQQLEQRTQRGEQRSGQAGRPGRQQNAQNERGGGERAKERPSRKAEKQNSETDSDSEGGERRERIRGSR